MLLTLFRYIQPYVCIKGMLKYGTLFLIQLEDKSPIGRFLLALAETQIFLDGVPRDTNSFRQGAKGHK